jgi:acid phosphatase type 7
MLMLVFHKLFGFINSWDCAESHLPENMLTHLLTFASAIAFASALEQIKLNYDASTSHMVVTFADVNSKETTAYVRYGTDENKLDQTATAVGSTYTLGSYTSPMLFKATLVDLVEGNQIYYYSVGSDTLGYSDVMSFKSHPGVAVDDVTFFVIGDLGQTSNSETTLAELIETESGLTSLSGGIINAGDLSYANGDQPLWDSFGKMMQSASATLPMMTTLGNQ